MLCRPAFLNHALILSLNFIWCFEAFWISHYYSCSLWSSDFWLPRLSPSLPVISRLHHWINADSSILEMNMIEIGKAFRANFIFCLFLEEDSRICVSTVPGNRILLLIS